MILYCTIVLGILVVIHEGGHYLASRAFGVRVTEFMLGMPGPNIGFKKWGTKFGVGACGAVSPRHGEHGRHRRRLRHHRRRGA